MRELKYRSAGPPLMAQKLSNRGLAYLPPLRFGVNIPSTLSHTL